MDASTAKVIEMQVAKTMENLRKNNMEAYYVKTRAEVAEKVEKLLHEGDTIGVGGSVTLTETGVLSLLRNGKYHFLDRYAPLFSYTHLTLPTIYSV